MKGASGNSILNLLSLLVLIAEGCSHIRVNDFFAESLWNNKFNSYKCQNIRDLKSGTCDKNKWEMMGMFVNTTARGKYFLEVNENSPYAKGR